MFEYAEFLHDEGTEFYFPRLCLFTLYGPSDGGVSVLNQEHFVIEDVRYINEALPDDAMTIELPAHTEVVDDRSHALVRYLTTAPYAVSDPDRLLELHRGSEIADRTAAAGEGIMSRKFLFIVNTVAIVLLVLSFLWKRGYSRRTGDGQPSSTS